MLTDTEVDTLRSIRSELKRLDDVLLNIAIDGKVNGERRNQIGGLLASAQRLAERLA